MNHSQEISLFELNGIVKGALKSCFPDRYWVRAELSDVKENYASGHCYVEFIEKDARRGAIIAKAKGNIWAFNWNLLKPYFEQQTQQRFTAGIKVLVEVSVEFHELYGYSLTVHSIDPSYTIGDMARKRAEIIHQLQEDGVINMNKELELSVTPSRIAIISSATAAGLEDFMNQLTHNENGYAFYTHLFPAVMQGSQTEESIIAALNKIYKYRTSFDVVVLIRGGGATSDLNSFDSYLLAQNCAQFPLPMITGIGHERDETVLDVIAHTRVKTPTAAAEFLIAKMDEAFLKVRELQTDLSELLRGRLVMEKQRIVSASESIPYLVKHLISRNHSRLELLQHSLKGSVYLNLQNERVKLQLLKERITTTIPLRMECARIRFNALQQIIEQASPDNILKKGYSLTLLNGKTLKSASEISRGDRVTTIFAQGSAESLVTNLNYNNESIDSDGKK